MSEEKKDEGHSGKRFVVRTRSAKERFVVGKKEFTNEPTEVSQAEAGRLKTQAAIAGARLIIEEKGA